MHSPYSALARGLGLWILTSALQNADERVLQAKEVQLRGRSKKVQASEYTWQALFGLLGRAVLQTQPQLSSCKMLAEVYRQLEGMLELDLNLTIVSLSSEYCLCPCDLHAGDK